jgi:catechol 2,3-dioxygenase-like lactoylglutathione lyase family enzyme
MQTHLGHIQVNVAAENLPFYQDLFAFLEWPVIHDGDGALGLSGKSNDSIWFVGGAKEVENDYDGPGMNHIGIGAGSQADVDETVVYLPEHGIDCLFETPRHRPDFAMSEEHTYYQVMFESPDRVLFEVVYTGPKQG